MRLRKTPKRETVFPAPSAELRQVARRLTLGCPMAFVVAGVRTWFRQRYGSACGVMELCRGATGLRCQAGSFRPRRLANDPHTGPGSGPVRLSSGAAPSPGDFAPALIRTPQKRQKRQTCRDAGGVKMKKAFWEPPKKPFLKIVLRRKVVSSFAGVAPNGTLNARDIFNENQASYTYSLIPRPGPFLLDLDSMQYPSGNERQGAAKMCPRSGSAGAPHQGHHHLVLSNNPRLESSWDLYLSKSINPGPVAPSLLLAAMAKIATKAMSPTARLIKIHSMILNNRGRGPCH